MQDVVKYINEKFLSQNPCTVQKVTSSPHFLCWHCRFPGKSIYLYFGRGASHQGIAVSDNNLPARLRVIDRFLEYSRKHWRNLLMTSLYVDENDRIVTILARSKYSENKIYFFWRGRDLFFSHAFHEDEVVWLYNSWEGKQAISLDTFKELEGEAIFKDLGYGNESAHKDTLNIEEYIEHEDIYKSSERLVNKEKKKNKSLYRKLEVELSKITQALNLKEYTDSDLTEVNEVGEGRFKIKLYNINGHYKKRDLVFTKIKQWKDSKKIIENRLLKTKNKSITKDKVQSSNVKIVSPVWVVKKEKSKIEKNEHYVSLKYKDFSCFLGRTSSENDYIRNKIAKKTDLWVHLDNLKSGHLFIRGGKPDVNDMTILTSAMVDICNIQIEQMDIIFTNVANIKGLKGARGAITFKKEKRLSLYYDQEWRQKVSAIDEQ